MTRLTCSICGQRRRDVCDRVVVQSRVRVCNECERVLRATTCPTHGTYTAWSSPPRCGACEEGTIVRTLGRGRGQRPIPAPASHRPANHSMATEPTYHHRDRRPRASEVTTTSAEGVVASRPAYSSTELAAIRRGERHTWVASEDHTCFACGDVIPQGSTMTVGRTSYGWVHPACKD